VHVRSTKRRYAETVNICGNGNVNVY